MLTKNFDQEQVFLEEEINLLDHLVKQIHDLRRARCLKDKKLISNLTYSKDLQCQDPAIVKNDQDAQHGKCLLLKDFKKR